MDFLADAARLGIESEYVDANGRRRQVPADVIAKVAAALRGGMVAPRNGAVLPQSPPAFARRAYQGPPGRNWLLAVQLYGVRSQRNWGHGDFADLRGLIELAAQAGAAGVGINPLHALFDESPEQPSPYSPNSRLFLNPLYIAVDEIPEFEASRDAIDDAIAGLRQSELVDYAGVAALKQRHLREAYRTFVARGAPERRADFATFRRTRSALTRCACFEVLRRRFGRPWWQWPSEWRNPDEAALTRLRADAADEIGYTEYVQWIADRQLMACHDRAHALSLAIGLYLDVAVGVQPDGFDAWDTPDAIVRTLSVGAPPDLLNSAGQNWGLAGFSGVGLAARDFQPYRDMLRAAMRYAGAIRLDHVLGLKRLYVIPDGLRPDQGTYVRLPFEQMLSVAAEESVRSRCIVIGEDLGTVPDGFRAQLAQWGLWSYQVMLFERDASGAFWPPEHYAEHALATFATHDLPTFAGWVDGHDLRVKRALHLDAGESDRARAGAIAQLRRALDTSAKTVDFPATLRFLAQSRAKMLVVALDDVLGVREQANIPGTIDQHPNWRRKLPRDLERIGDDERLRTVARIAADAGRAPGAPGVGAAARSRNTS